jgi:hypothetical protein
MSLSVLAPTDEELSEMTPQQIAERKRAMEDNVFGANCPRDRLGKPIEQGIGSASRQSSHHLQALAREKATLDQMKAMAKIAGTASD